MPGTQEADTCGCVEVYVGEVCVGGGGEERLTAVSRIQSPEPW